MRLDPAGANRPLQPTFPALAHCYVGRFAEPCELSDARSQFSERLGRYPVLAASDGHLAETGPALEALARYRALSPLPLETWVLQLFINPAQRKLVLDGVAL